MPTQHRHAEWIGSQFRPLKRPAVLERLQCFSPGRAGFQQGDDVSLRQGVDDFSPAIIPVEDIGTDDRQILLLGGREASVGRGQEEDGEQGQDGCDGGSRPAPEARQENHEAQGRKKIGRGKVAEPVQLGDEEIQLAKNQAGGQSSERQQADKGQYRSKSHDVDFLHVIHRV